ncbi:Crp/Fnr family transcriptional regulator [Aliamphritea hakodatensis]|uniref:Crp/Fnr family transcriptional regulator n=1 Tax=Aliamphritea hakodatensis TaxID=2895352 RepID=UPI0022FD6FAF|nr:Crp/Fnr family transcriptional regulator [Aliamphritea hakodatensis]
MSHWHLESLNWLDRLSADDQEALRCASRVMEFAPREMVFTPNLEADAVYLLEKGLVRIFRTSSNGGEFTFGFIKPGEIFGELAVLGERQRRSFAEVVEAGLVLKVSRDVFLEVMHRSGEFSLEVSQQVEKRSDRARFSIEDLVFKDARSRLARKLLELDDKNRAAAARDATAVNLLKLTHADLAKLTGMSRPTASIALGELEDDSLVEQHAGVFEIINRDALQQIACKDLR